MSKKDIKDLINALKVGGPMLWKYPIGNPELTKKIKSLEHERKIFFDEYYNQWEVKK